VAADLNRNAAALCIRSKRRSRAGTPRYLIPCWTGTTMVTEECLRFVPSRVEGLADVSEVAIYSDRLELLSAGKWVAFRFTDIATWPRPAWLRKSLCRLGWRPRWLPVADRDWFHAPRDRFFAFYTRPPIVVYLADEDQAVGYIETLFRRIQAVISAGGFSTSDMG
jgi:hypothetical protein